MTRGVATCWLTQKDIKNIYPQMLLKRHTNTPQQIYTSRKTHTCTQIPRCPSVCLHTYRPCTHTMYLSCVSEMSSVSTMCVVCAACLSFPWQSHPIPWHAFCMDDGELFSWRRWSHPFSYASALYTHSSPGHRAEGCAGVGSAASVWAPMKNAKWRVSKEQLRSSLTQQLIQV